MTNFGNGGIICEDKGNWVAGADPETIDITNFTAEGTDYWFAEYSEVEDAPSFNADYEGLPGWTGISLSIEEGYQLIKISGTYQGATFAITQTKEDNLQKMFREHSALDDEDLYFVKRWSANSYKKFPNASRSLVKYMKCGFDSAPKTKITERVLNFSFTLRSLW